MKTSLRKEEKEKRLEWEAECMEGKTIREERLSGVWLFQKNKSMLREEGAAGRWRRLKRTQAWMDAGRKAS